MEKTKCLALLECAERGSITSAAKALGYTPSAISQLISSLEDELGLKLLSRSAKGVRLTSEGETILPKVRSFLAHEKEIYQTAEELRGIFNGTLTITAYPSIAMTWLPEIVRKFKSDYPGIQINIQEGIREQIYDRLSRNEADLGMLIYDEAMPFEWIPLTESRIIAALPEDHPLADRESFPVKACEEYEMAIGSWGREKEIINIFVKNGVNPNIRYTTYDTPASLALVRMGLCIGIVNELSAQVWTEHLVKMPLDPPESVVFGIAVPSEEHMTSAARKFLSYTINYFNE